MKLVSYNDPILTKELSPVTFPFEGAWDIVVEMIETMREHNGLGLAANQVGLDHRMFVMEGKEPIACFNPKVIDFSTETVKLEEGCLSYPGLIVKIERPKIIKVRYQDADGQIHTEKFDGITARTFQHELDHVNGIRFYDRAGRVHRDIALRRWRNKF